MIGSGVQVIGEGRYQLVAVLGQGGMATVYRAHDSRLGVDRAIKILSSQYSASANIRARFQSEARTMARLRHPHILSVHDVELDGHQVYMVMELLHGGTLWDWVEAHGRMPPHMAAAVMIPVLEAIEVAHADGVIHRDLKPQNILLTIEGKPKVTDFGIARVADRNSALTKTTAVLGTQGYMAPEQRTASRNVDERSDVYSLGATLYALVTGRTPVDLIALAIDDSLLDGVDPHVAQVIRKAAAYKPDDRYQDTAEMVASLRDCLGNIPPVPPGPPALGELPERPPGAGLMALGGGTLDLAPKVPTSPSNSSETFLFAEETAVPDAESLRGLTTHGDPEPEIVIAPAIEPSRRRWMAVVFGLLVGLGGATWAVSSLSPKGTAPPAVQVAPPPPTPVQAVPVPVAQEPVPASEPTPEPVAASPAPKPTTAPARPEPKPKPATRPETKPATKPRPAPVAAEPAPAPKPEPTAEPEVVAPAPVAEGRWSWSGDAVRVQLVGADGRKHGTGTVPAGSYQILAVFDDAGTAIPAGSTTVPDGGSRTIKCNGIFQKCQ